MSSKIGIGIFVVALAFIATLRPYIVEGPSMRPAFEPNDRLLVESISPRLGLLSRGDVIVFPDPRDPKHPIMIKRIVGLPNETVRVEFERVVILHPNGTEEVFPAGTLLGGSHNSDTKETVLGPEDYFVMGDNRDESIDSRHWGTIQPHEMTGKPIARLAPFSRLKLFP